MEKSNNIGIPFAAITLFFFGLLLFSCQKLEMTRLIKIKTGEYFNLTATSVTLTGELIDAGEAGVLEYGICWSTESNPEPYNSDRRPWGWTADSQSFQTDIMGLIWNTTYYFRAYCMITASEYILGEVKSFTTPYDAIFRQLPVGIAPTIDGNIDEIWSHIEKHNIERDFYGSLPTLDSAYWQGAWNSTELYILVAVYENIHIDMWDLPENESYEYHADRPEVYIDVNEILKDGLGPDKGDKEIPKNAYGHYQFVPQWLKNVNQTTNTGSLYWQNVFYSYGYLIQEPNYVMEITIPWSSLKDINGNNFAPFNNKEFGFDVCILDRDYITKQREFKVWRNTGGPDFNPSYNYYNMDGAGVAVLSKDVIK